MIVVDPHTDEVRRRQRARARITGLALAGFAVLTFFITIAKMRLYGG
jgi:hypothetical protein